MKGVFTISAFLAASVTAINVRNNLGDHRMVSMDVRDLTEDLKAILREHEADIFGKTEETVDFKLSPEALEAINGKDFKMKDTTEDWISHFERNLANPNLFCSKSAEECGSKTLDEFYTSYQRLDTIYDRVSGFVEASENAKMVTYGQSHEGRDLKLIEIGDDSKPLAFLFCNIHAREWLTPMFCSFLLETLLSGTDTLPESDLDSKILSLLDTFSLAIIPSANPDGYNFSIESDNMWRKTRKPNAGSSCVGTDGNRNWDNNHCGVGSSSNPCSQTYCGTFPFDQPEVAALNDYALKNVERIILMLDIHAYGSYVIHPYGYTEELPAEEDYIRMRQCAREGTSAATEVTGTEWLYGTTPQVLGYTSGGTSKDYFYANLGVVYPYTVEVRGNSFQPDTSEIPVCMEETLALVESMLSCVKKIDLDGFGPSPTAPPTPEPTRPCEFFFC